MEDHLCVLVIRLVAISSHLFGLYLLYCSKLTKINPSQRIFLINLSISEIMLCCFGIIEHLTHHYEYDHIGHHFKLFHWSGLCSAFLCIMIILTLDRFFESYLSIRYPLYWSSKRAKHVVATVWSVSLLFSLATLIYQPTNEVLERFCSLYLFPTLELIFLLVTMLTYGYILIKLQEHNSQIEATSNTLLSAEQFQQNRLKKRNMSLTVHRKRRIKGLILPSAIIVTFILFMVIPDQIYFYCYLHHKTMDNQLTTTLVYVYCTSYISDAFIYIFLSHHVRKTLSNKLRRFQVKRKSR